MGDSAPTENGSLHTVGQKQRRANLKEQTVRNDLHKSLVFHQKILLGIYANPIIAHPLSDINRVLKKGKVFSALCIKKAISFVQESKAKKEESESVEFRNTLFIV
jgi:hypothetical protein